MYSWQGAPPSLIHSAHPSLPYVVAAAAAAAGPDHPLAAAAAAAALPRPAGAAALAAAAAVAAPGAFLLRILLFYARDRYLNLVLARHRERTE